MSTELTTYRSIGSDPASALAFIDSMGKAFHQGGLAGCKSEGQGKAMALTCLCDNITPLQFVRTYHLMDGKPSMRADAMLAAFMAAGGKWKWIDQGDDGKKASAHVAFGDNDLEVSYTIDDAKRAGLIKEKSNWEKDPGSMLRARTISKAVRMVAPQIVAGVYTPEELVDFRSTGGMPTDDVTATVVSSKSEPESPAAKKSRQAKPAPAETKPAKREPVKAEIVDEPAAAESSKQSQTEQLMAEAGASGAIEFINSDMRNEIQKIQTQFELTKFAYAWMAKRDLEHINKLTVQQGRRLLVDLYVAGLGFAEKRDAILAREGLASLDDASEELIQQMLDSLRAKYDALPS